MALINPPDVPPYGLNKTGQPLMINMSPELLFSKKDKKKAKNLYRMQQGWGKMGPMNAGLLEESQQTEKLMNPNETPMQANARVAQFFSDNPDAKWWESDIAMDAIISGMSPARKQKYMEQAGGAVGTAGTMAGSKTASAAKNSIDQMAFEEMLAANTGEYAGIQANQELTDTYAAMATKGTPELKTANKQAPTIKQGLTDGSRIEVSNFDEAFGVARNAGLTTFKWTNPKTGKTITYGTELDNSAEEERLLREQQAKDIQKELDAQQAHRKEYSMDSWGKNRAVPRILKGKKNVGAKVQGQ